MASGRRSWFLAACGQSYCHIELSLELFECFHELTAGFSQRVILDRVRWKLQCLKWPLLWSPQNSICTKVSHDWAYTHTHTHTHTQPISVGKNCTSPWLPGYGTHWGHFGDWLQQFQSFYFDLLLFSHSVVSDSSQSHVLQHARLPCPLLSPRVCSNSCPLSQWCLPTISSSVTPFYSCLQSFPASRSFPVSQLFTSGGQSMEASASSVSPSNEYSGWFPLGLTGLISLLSKRLSWVLSSTTVQKHQFFSA